MRWFRKRPPHPLRQAALDALDKSIAAAAPAEAALEAEGIDGPTFAAFRGSQREAIDALDAWIKAGMPR